MKTNNELGAIYLEVEGLDKERFKKLTKGMEFWGAGVDAELSDDKGYLENYGGSTDTFEWMTVNTVFHDSRKITLDELEELLHGKKRTAEVIQSEIDALQLELDELNKIKVGDVVMSKTGLMFICEGYDSPTREALKGSTWYFDCVKIDPSKSVNEILGLISS